MRGWPDPDFDAFVAARLTALVRFAYALTGDIGHAEDVVQTALVKTYLATRRQRPDDPDAYVRRAIVTANVSRFRRRRVVEDLVDILPELPTPDAAQQLEEHEAFDSRLAGLSHRQRTVIVLRYQEDWSEAQIADAMGVSPGTVKTMASRAMGALRTSLPTTEKSAT